MVKFKYVVFTDLLNTKYVCMLCTLLLGSACVVFSKLISSFKVNLYFE